MNPKYQSSRQSLNLKCLIINVPLRENSKPNTPPQGPLLLAARLRELSSHVSILDFNAYRIRDAAAERRTLPNGRMLEPEEARGLMARHLAKYGTPDLIGVSGIITTLRWQETICRMARELAPEALLISGGGLATEIREGLLDWIPELDAVAHSEGDKAILLAAEDALSVKNRGRKWLHEAAASEFRGQLIRPGKILYHGTRPKDLDSLPWPALDLLHEDADGNPVLEWYITTPVWGGAANNSSATPFTMERSLTTVSSRGCPYDCNFCYRGAQGERNYGMRSAGNLLEEARRLVETYGIDFLGYPDDNFAVDRKRVAELPQTLGKLGLRWGTHTRMDEADERLADMAKGGCIYIGFGAESASPKVLSEMGKGGFILKRGLVDLQGFGKDFPRSMVEAVRNCRNAGIHSNCTWIMGYPGEEMADLKASASFILWQQSFATSGLAAGTEAHRIAIASINRKMFTATAYPGTKMFRHPRVRQLLEQHFGIGFDATNKPLHDEGLRRYILELDDATKLLHGRDGKPLNFSSISDGTFIEARRLIDADRLENVLDL